MEKAKIEQFQGVPRQLLDSILPPAGTTKAAPRLAVKPEPSPASASKQPKSVPMSDLGTGAAAVGFNKLDNTNIIVRAIAIVAKEIGVPVSDLTDDIAFGDFGVDSLLSLTISGKFREELDIDVDSLLFVECPTVKEMKHFFLRNSLSGVATPAAEVSLSGESSTVSLTPKTETEVSFSDDGSDTSIEDNGNLMTTIRLTIAEEIGIPIEEITGSSDLTNMGMDSLMSLTVLGRLRETLNIELPSDLFGEKNPNLDAIEASLGIKPQTAPVRSKPKVTGMPAENRATDKMMPPATSILLQGNPKTAKKTLFLFPDGSGSSTSYAPLPRIGADIVVYGLNCPYMKQPQDLKCSLDGLTAPYLAEIRRRQPRGPYYFGGWSAGGICAYDAAQQVLAHGEEVARLILLDSPFPIGLEKLPPRLYHFFESIGLFGSGHKAPPEWLLPHFLAFIDALDAYQVKPFAKGTAAPKTYLIWARDGVCKHVDDPRPELQADDPKEMKWLLENRTDFGPNGWDGLLGGKENLVIETLADVNHFSMMTTEQQGGKVKELGAFIGRAMQG